MDSKGILQAYLDEVSTATLKGDWETYRDHVALPCAVISHDESKIIETEEDLRAGFDQFRGSLQALRVTDYIRLVENAARLDHDLISGSYISHIIAGGQRIVAPYRSIMTLRLVGNRWKAASVTNGLANSRWPLIRLELPKEGT
ncbi:hypothetical protein [Stagnihabitans tardus]|uniref:SnoaL-like domain-containing protein n=1 Tax=Stagnihabitans tardus TaxID=2699202 RepID=A0AAE4YAU4_9RHOB|nr:hypothetical protein [Stagnihabitans tardus]NBZ88509.1 hypothetical protein [Stagnihabitans tardus]